MRLNSPQRASALTCARENHGDIAGAVADHGHGLFGQGGQHQLALSPVRQRLSGRWIDDLRIKVVFDDVQAVMLVAFAADAGSSHLRKPVHIECLNAALTFNVLPHGFGPGLSAENSDPQRQFLHIHA